MGVRPHRHGTGRRAGSLSREPSLSIKDIRKDENMTNSIFDLQFFAEAGSLVNTTEGFVNAATGEQTAFDNSHSLSAELKAFYDTELLENARTELFYAQFAKRQPLPANHHGSVEWRKWNTFDKASKRYRRDRRGGSVRHLHRHHRQAGAARL